MSFGDTVAAPPLECHVLFEWPLMCAGNIARLHSIGVSWVEKCNFSIRVPSNVLDIMSASSNHRANHLVGTDICPNITAKNLRQCVTGKFTLFRITRNSGIPTDGNLTEINCTSKTPELLGNLTEILTELRNFRY